MSRKGLALVLCLLLALSPFSLGVYGAKTKTKDKISMEPDPGIIRLDPETAKVTKRSVTIYQEGVTVSSVTGVYFDQELLSYPIHYTLRKDEDGGTVVTLKKAFLKRQKIGTYDFRIECDKYSLDTDFVVDTTYSTVEKEPPRTKFSLN